MTSVRAIFDSSAMKSSGAGAGRATIAADGRSAVNCPPGVLAVETKTDVLAIGRQVNEAD